MHGGHRGGRLPHVPALDGLRGVAVAVVVAFHLGRLQGGFLGVDLFFVLSGFLITSLLVAGWRHEGRVDLGAFWARRARRLIPAMLIVVGAVAVYARWWANPLEVERIRGDGLATLGYVANWRQVLSEADYWDTIRAPSPLLHTWSLAIEEQFYVVWPLVVGATALLVRRRRGTSHGLTGLLVATLALAVASVAAMVVLHEPGGSPQRVYLGTDTRASAILFGAAVALLFARRGDRPVGVRATRALEATGAVALAGLAVAWVGADGLGDWLYEGGLALCSAAAAVVIGATWAAPAGLLSRALSWSPLRFLGRISYGLYLWHWPVIVVVNPLRTGLDGVTLDGLRVAIGLGLATASYHLVELPVRRGLPHGRPAWVGAVGLPVLCVTMLLAGTVARPSPFTAEVQQAAAEPGKVIEATDGPAVVAPDPPERREVRAGPAADPVPRTVLVVGDSGAYYLGRSMTAVGNERGLAVYSRGIIGCSVGRIAGPFRRLDGRVVTQPPECDGVTERWRFFLGLADPDLVLLNLAWPGGGGAQDVGGEWRTDCDPTHDARLREVFEDELRVLASTGARTAATTIPYRISPYDPDAGRDETECRNQALRAASAATGTQVVDLAGWACPFDRCALERDGVTLRPDLVHFAGPGADVAARWVLDQLTRADQ